MFFFFKQKTAYEVRISDWSSDVCSSDLELADDAADTGDARVVLAGPHRLARGLRIGAHRTDLDDIIGFAEQADARLAVKDRPQIGRASGRERVCQYV